MKAQAVTKLPRTPAKQVDLGDRVVPMATKVLGDKPASLITFTTSNSALKDAITTAEMNRQAWLQSIAEVKLKATGQGEAYSALVGYINSVADGNVPFILSCGVPVRSTPTPTPPLQTPPADVTTRINGVPGRVYLSWKSVKGARNYEVQYTTDLTGATGWVTLAETPGKTRTEANDLTSGTRYAFRVRAMGNGERGPWSGPVQQMVA